MSNTLDQQRAAYSLKAVDEVKEKIKKSKKDSDLEWENKGDDYAGYVVNLAGAIRVNGLGQALAQLLAAAKGQEEDPHLWLYRHISTWICKEHQKSRFKKQNQTDLLRALVNEETTRKDYQWAVVETMAFLEWHRKIAVAELKKTDPGSEGKKNGQE
ncbi:MAG: type III-B CRISPR module-associated protein Cmr5 [Thermoactinomyces sp.]